MPGKNDLITHLLSKTELTPLFFQSPLEALATITCNKSFHVNSLLYSETCNECEC